MQQIKHPPSLNKNATIGITCPSGHLPIERTVWAKRIIEEWGFNVIMGSTVGHEYFYFSETDERRLFDLQSMLDDDRIDAILMGRGGYGLSRIIDKLDFTRFIQKPKWICGFSDITVLHSHIHRQFNIATLHSPMCAAFKQDTGNDAFILSVLNAWTGRDFDYPIPFNEHNRTGTGQGQLVGGNLAILAHLSGSTSQINTDGKILFIEDVGEYIYSIDRMLMNLKRAGTLEHLNGLICGGFTELKDTVRPFGQDIYNIILDKVAEYDYPVCFDFPSGHLDINYTLRLGMEHTLTVSDTKAVLNCNNFHDSII